jgi:glycine/D-amino acid oxidase-like deaminating enzyme/nitrite reductase/ring-hydroxylating ferredoxin subunit
VAALPGKPVSLWLDRPQEPRRPPLEGDHKTDVAIVGGGIVGAAAALFLARRGVSVVLVEARAIAGGVTGHSTAKATALHQTAYSDIARKAGREAAAAHAEANVQGVGLILSLAAEHGIECSLEIATNFLYTEDEQAVARVEAECDAAADAGLGVELTDETDLPFGVRAAAQLDGQVAFDSAAFTRGLAAAAERAGARLHEDSRVRSVAHGNPCRLRLENGGSLTAGHVIIATEMPLLDRGLFFARLRPQMSYAVAAPADDAPRGMYLGIGETTRSIRSTEGHDGRRHLIVGGEGHKVGQGDGAASYAKLASWARERFAIAEIGHRWSAHDLMSPDGLPMIGKLAPWSPGILTATGFGKWGLAKGVSAAAMLCGELVGEPDPKAEVFSPGRLNLRGQAVDIVKENANVAIHFVGDRLRHRGAPRCTHLGCLLSWNAGDETWDCPCHGSRFAADGSVLNGPASAPLALGSG